MPKPEHNRVHLHGRLHDIRQRWTPDGKLAVIAALAIPRPKLGAVRAQIQQEQPIPLRASGPEAEAILKYQEQLVNIEGCLRRRYYSREGEPSWGQVEVWVDLCRPERIEENEDE